MLECCNSLAQYMEGQGPGKAMDVDELLLRESMDVIGQLHRKANLIWLAWGSGHLQCLVWHLNPKLVEEVAADRLHHVHMV